MLEYFAERTQILRITGDIVIEVVLLIYNADTGIGQYENRCIVKD